MNVIGLINDKIAGYKEHLSIIEGSFELEMMKEHSKRRPRYITFLAQERSVYSFAAAEMDEVLRAMLDKTIVGVADEKT